VQMGLSTRSAVLVLYGVGVLLGIDAFIVSRSTPETALILVGATALLALAAFVLLERFRIRQRREGKL